MPYKIQSERSLVNKVLVLEKLVQELSTKDAKEEQAEAEAPISNPGGFGNRLMITQGISIPPQAPPPMPRSSSVPPPSSS